MTLAAFVAGHALFRAQWRERTEGGEVWHDGLPTQPGVYRVRYTSVEMTTVEFVDVEVS
ncbi:MAG: hypothetical protein IT186_01435 [Acidobacteria bacterium]|nr:hypothetical protein [Acidobacteriota bacterium]MCG3195346.1 hypothetical protein [Thermoanaerobaculia bacterium]MCK6681051.1 hypothetical protein [Thermoanaerobaculia bacterium]